MPPSSRTTLPLLALAVSVLALLSGRPAAAKTLEEVDPKVRTEVIEKARAYFDETVDRWLGRKDFRASLDKLAATAGDPLKDLDLFLQILYQGRSFQDDFANKGWQKTNDIRVFAQSGPYSSILSERMRFTYALPASYPKKQQLEKNPRPGPLPLLFVFHEEQDYTGDEKSHPGESVLKRWWPKAEFGPIYDSWLMLAPAAPRAKFLEEDGSIRKEFATEVFAQMWKRYHVDFDRVVLDGSDAALAMAAAQPVFFSALVLRGGKVDPATVRNFASLPVYVVKNEQLKQDLEAAGHPNVTLGEASGLPEWLGKQRRVLPTKFSWNVAKPDQVLAHWVSIDSLDAGAAERRLDVEIDREANRIRIDAKGIFSLALFLNDRLVDLDREVEIVLNGHEDKRKLERNFDRLLDKEPLRIRLSMYLGWLFPTALPGLEVRPPVAKAAEPEAPKPPAPPATEPAADSLAEDKAQRLWEKAVASEEAGDLAKAKELFGKVVDAGNTTLRAKAEAKVQELDAKIAGGK